MQLISEIKHKNPLVSVVMNNYNNQEFLDESISSILNQDYQNIEIIIVDAVSTDQSRKIIDSYASKDKRIRKIYMDCYTKYPAISYNIGFIESNGEFIAIADPDDISLNNRISSQVEYLLHNTNIEIVGSDCFEFDENSEKIVQTNVSKNIQTGAPPVRNPTLLFRKQILSKYGLWDWRCEFAADFEWLYRFYSQGACFGSVPKPLVKYRRSAGNISHSLAYEQTKKLLKFWIYFGFYLFPKAGILWWKRVLDTFLYLIIIVFRR